MVQDLKVSLDESDSKPTLSESSSIVLVDKITIVASSAFVLYVIT